MMNKLRFLFPVLYLGLASPAWSDFARTPQEELLCKSMGILNHECDCVRFVNRAYASMNDKVRFKFNLGEALGGCNYHLAHQPETDPWHPTAYLQIGIIQQLLGNQVESLSSLNKALQLNPKLEQAYSEMANAYLKFNNKDSALKTITEGLRWLPDSNALKRRYQKLGGALPYPTPHAQAIKPTQPATPERATSKAPDGAGSAKPAASGATQTASGNPPGEVSPPTAIGSSTNPWCRFCADTPPADPATSPSTPGVIPKGGQ